VRGSHTTNPWLVLVLICVAQFMVILDATIVNVALPSIQKDLGLSEANLQWIINSYTLVSTTFAEGRERARALGVWAAIAIGGSAVGLVLGGFLTQTFSWPWIFFVNVPVGIAGFILSLRYVPESKDEHAHKGYDVAGAVTVTGGLMALVYAIVHAASHGWGSTQTIVFFVVAAVLLTAFVLIELRAEEPLVRLSIFRVRSLLTANVVMFLVPSGLFAMFFFNTLYIQKVLGYGPLEAGVAFLPFTAGIMVSAGLASNFATRVGVRPIAAAGMSLTIVGMLLLTRLPVNGSYAMDVLPSLLLTSLGMGAVFMPLTLIATTGLEDDDQGLASGLFNTSQQIGGALGLAILSTVAASRTVDLGGSSDPAALVGGFHWAFAGGAIFVAAALVTLVALLRKRHVARIEAEAAQAEPVMANV
jgi:EmrB/QacA subfamily drug resistance transporter